MKYLLFDADETIWDFKATEKIGLSLIYKKYGLPDTEETTAEYMVGNLSCWADYEKGLINLNELEVLRWELFFSRIGKNYSAEEAAAFFGDVLSHNGILLKGAKKFLESISSYDKALVTNGISRIQRARIKDTGLDKYFNKIFISDEIGYRKPQKELFDYVLKDINKNKEDCIMIGDSEKSDIRGAINAGLESIYISFKGEKSSLATYSVSSYEELRDLIERI